MLKIIAVAACVSLMLAFVMLAFENIPLGPANNGSDAVLGLAAGAALGAVTANALNNNNRVYDRGYSREPRVINNTTVIKEKKVVVVQAPQQKPAYSQTQSIAPKVNLSKPTISSQSYKSPTVTMKQSSPSTSYGKR